MEIIKTRGSHYANRKKYVEQILGASLEAVNGFGDIRYERSYTTGEEYIRLRDYTLTPCYLDVTALDNDSVWREVVGLICIDDMKSKGYPKHIVTDSIKLRKVAGLFRKEA